MTLKVVPPSEPPEKEGQDFIVEISPWLSYIVNAGAKRFKALINYHTVDDRVATTEETALAAAYFGMQMKLHEMIMRYEPWRRYDNFQWSTPDDGFPEATFDQSKIMCDTNFPQDAWGKFACHLQAIIGRMRQYMPTDKVFDGWRLWAEERESDDYAVYQLRGEDGASCARFWFKPSDEEGSAVMFRVFVHNGDEAEHEWTSSQTVYLVTNVIDPMARMVALLNLMLCKTAPEVKVGLKAFNQYNQKQESK